MSEHVEKMSKNVEKMTENVDRMGTNVATSSAVKLCGNIAKSAGKMEGRVEEMMGERMSTLGEDMDEMCENLDQMSEENGKMSLANGFLSKWVKLEMKYVSLFLLIVQTVSVVLLIRYTRMGSSEKYINSTAVVFCEGVKFVGSLLMLAFESYGEESTVGLERPTIFLGVQAVDSNVKLGKICGGKSGKEKSKTWIEFWWGGMWVKMCVKIWGDAVFSTNMWKMLVKMSEKVENGIFWDKYENVKILVPGILYMIQNNLIFLALSHISGAVYQVTYQLKILSTAIFSVLILGTRLKNMQIFALLLLFIGVVCLQLEEGISFGNYNNLSNSSYWVGTGAVLCACLTSGLSGVYFEALLKRKAISIWVRNLQLSFFGFFFGALLMYIQDRELVIAEGFFSNYSPLVILTLFVQAAGGLIVAAVLKYADNLLKCFGNALSIIFSAILSALLFQDFTLTPPFLIGTTLILYATALYTTHKFTLA